MEKGGEAMSTEEPRDAYDAAEVYGLGEEEEMACGSPEEVIAEVLEGLAEINCDMAELIARHSPITVCAYARDTVPETYADTEATIAVEELVERFDDAFGAPDGGSEPDENMLKEMREHVARAVRLMVETMSVWNCSKVASRTYGAAEVEQMMREANPDWFEEESEMSTHLETLIVGVPLPDAEMARLDALCARHGVRRRDWLTAVVTDALDRAEALEAE